MLDIKQISVPKAADVLREKGDVDGGFSLGKPPAAAGSR
jgi:hypothetical protein